MGGVPAAAGNPPLPATQWLPPQLPPQRAVAGRRRSPWLQRPSPAAGGTPPSLRPRPGPGPATCHAKRPFLLRPGPLPSQFMDVWANETTVGLKGEDVACPANNTGLFAAARELGPPGWPARDLAPPAAAAGPGATHAEPLAPQPQPQPQPQTGSDKLAATAAPYPRLPAPRVQASAP